MFCKYCGKEIDDDAVFCTYCGKRLNSGIYSNDPISDSEVNFTLDSEMQPQDSEEPEINSEADSPPCSTQQNENSKKDRYTLTIVRENQWYAYNPAVKVKIDGEREYHLENDSTIRVPIDQGEHVISFSCGPRKRIVTKNITGDAVLSMKWNRFTGAIEVV